MSATDSLKIQRETVLATLHARRLEFTEPAVPESTTDADFFPGAPRSATMRFIVNHPALCMWVVSECLPFVLTTFLGDAGKRCARALRSDRR